MPKTASPPTTVTASTMRAAQSPGAATGGTGTGRCGAVEHREARAARASGVMPELVVVKGRSGMMLLRPVMMTRCITARSRGSQQPQRCHC